MLNVFQRVKEKRRDMAKYTVAVAGATGYAGGEALRILAAHPNFEVTCVAGHSSVGDKLGKHMPTFRSWRTSWSRTPRRKCSTAMT